MKRFMARQGDVFIIQADNESTETTAAAKDPRGLVLAEGETSGHHHQVFGGGAKLMQFRDAARQERLLIVGKGGAEVRVIGGGSGGVDRHTPVSLAAGKFLIRVQKSWSLEQAASERVAD